MKAASRPPSTLHGLKERGGELVGGKRFSGVMYAIYMVKFLLWSFSPLVSFPCPSAQPRMGIWYESE